MTGQSGNHNILAREAPSTGVITGYYSDGRPIVTFTANAVDSEPNGPQFLTSQYGAVYDGVTDDTAAITKAVAACVAAGGGAVVQAGRSLISSTIVIAADNVQLIGFGRGSELIAASTFTASTPMVQVQAPASGFRYGISLRDLLITNATAPTLTGVELNTTYWATLERVDIEGVYATSIYLNGQSGVYGAYTRISACHLGARPGGGGSAGVGIRTNNHEFCVVDSVTFNWFNLAGGTAVELFNNSFSFTNCTFDECDTSIALGGYGNTVANCHFDRGVTRFIAIHITNGNRIIGNDFQGFSGTGSQDAIYLDNNSADNLIAHNSFKAGSGWTNAIHDNANTGQVNYYTANDLGGLGFVLGKGVSRANVGYNPVGHLASQPAIPATTVAYTNTSGVDCTVYVTGGTVTAIAVGGSATGATAGAFRVAAGQTIALTYSVAPSWAWFGE